MRDSFSQKIFFKFYVFTVFEKVLNEVGHDDEDEDEVTGSGLVSERVVDDDCGVIANDVTDGVDAGSNVVKHFLTS